MTEDYTDTTPCHAVGRYTYRLDSEGCDDIWLIEGPGVTPLDAVRFFNDGDWRQETARTEARRMTYGYALLDALKEVLTAAAEVPPSAWTPRFEAAVNAAAELAEAAERGVRP